MAVGQQVRRPANRICRDGASARPRRNKGSEAAFRLFSRVVFPQHQIEFDLKPENG